MFTATGDSAFLPPVVYIVTSPGAALRVAAHINVYNRRGRYDLPGTHRLEPLECMQEPEEAALKRSLKPRQPAQRIRLCAVGGEARGDSTVRAHVKA